MEDLKSNKIYKKFIKNHGIITPIRASVFNHNGCLDYTMYRIAELIKQNPNSIIGYFVASKEFDIHHPKKTVGISIIHPEDYDPSFDKNISKIRAIAMAYNDEKEISNGAISKNSLMFSDKYIYVFQKTIREQFDEFVNRCDRYFNHN